MKKPFLLWRDDWQLGLECLDKQHMKLVDVLNQLHRFVVHEDTRHYSDRDQLCSQLKSLFDIARRHFKAEEGLMQAKGYPGLGDHRREHLMLLAELREHLREIETESKPFTVSTLTALKHWQIDHVTNSDRLFVDFLKHQPLSDDGQNFEAIAKVQAQPG
ncbi:MAG: bacteriohemerythrin [Candidatus Thiodiazotropha sp. (ex Ctena orbiculata)]|uniref:Bacteriohemerythrin n=1 Tax=Candidatus Thiodiazotropha taylori TaxID=2792791 RepID=A0A944M8G3_9GAMM|nr:bacteriohemerythrin [Candidatus Thiodiazotropha taylori]MBT2989020.1 bacteriohemerythrin [Candidatus Thiodiazotropha taylori]MBT2996333.1 bacteriohemerythrin [Candidatus Thiodiazotropha taylori]MBT3000233.1 bacteriohemerythrin [Candidatus Thiodiazotropha taylori]MBT3028170.1 bacteriohemerythrin [Candidatus Thiodiazotropha taylori]